MGSPAQMNGTNAHWPLFFKLEKVSPMETAARTGVAVARDAFRVTAPERVATFTPTKGEAAKAVAAMMSVNRRSARRPVEYRPTTAKCVCGRHRKVPCRCADACDY